MAPHGRAYGCYGDGGDGDDGKMRDGGCIDLQCNVGQGTSWLLVAAIATKGGGDDETMSKAPASTHGCDGKA